MVGKVTRAELAAEFAPRRRTIANLLIQQAEIHGEKTLAMFGERRVSFREMRDLAARFAGALKDAGVKSGDCVALMCGNRLEFLEAFLGCAWLGAIVVPINVAMRGTQLAHLISDSGPVLLLTEPDFLEAFQNLPLEPLPFKKIWIFGSPPATTVQGIPCVSAPERAASSAPAPVKAGDIAAILYTSGTTGPSKGVCCPNAQYFWWGVNAAHCLDLRSDDILFTCMPLFHVNALCSFFQSLLFGVPLVVERRFSASGFWPAIRESRATVTSLIGSIVPILLGRSVEPTDRGHELRVVMCPGVTPADFAAFPKRFGAPLLNVYGSTETNQIMGHVALPQRDGALGSEDENFEVRVVDEEDNEVAPGASGELVIRGREPYSLSAGYFNLPDKTVEAWRNLWFHTGDRVRRDEDGQFFFLDRIKDVIRRRGENISSYEVEDALRSHPAVGAATVYPVPSPLGEDEVMAAIVPVGGPQVDFLDIIKHCEQRLAYFCVPRYLRIVEELPVTESGKVQKYKLRTAGITAETFDLERSGYKLKR